MTATATGTGRPPAPLPDPARVVCVGGLHRSGTTPLARALAAHPQVSGLSATGVREDEGQHLQDVYPRAKVHGGSGRFARAAAAHLTETSPLVTPDAGERLLRAWVPYWDTARPVLVEKSPPDLLMGRFLQAVLPGSALVVVVRHPVVVALSTKKWRRLVSRDPRRHEGLAALVEHWVLAHRRLLEDLPHLRAAGGRVHLLHYEDLVRAPAVELARLQGFLGLDGAVPADGLTTARSERYERQWERAAAWWRPAHAWRRRVERRYGDDLAALGYDLDDLRARGPWSASARALAGPATPPDPTSGRTSDEPPGPPRR